MYHKIKTMQHKAKKKNKRSSCQGQVASGMMGIFTVVFYSDSPKQDALQSYAIAQSYHQRIVSHE